MNEKIIKVKGMKCSGCEKRVINAIRAEFDNIDVFADYNEGRVIIKSDDQINLDKIIEIINEIGFEA